MPISNHGVYDDRRFLELVKCVPLYVSQRSITITTWPQLQISSFFLRVPRQRRRPSSSITCLSPNPISKERSAVRCVPTSV
jgi:hypothetical protein